MGLAVLVLPGVELHVRQFHLLAVPLHGEPGAIGFGAHQLIKDVVGHKAAPAVHGNDLVPRLQAGLAAEGIVLNGIDGLAGDGSFLCCHKNDQHHKAQHEIHEGTCHHHKHTLPYRCLVQRDAGALLRRDRVFVLCFPFVADRFGLLALGAFLALQRHIAAYRQCTQAVLGALVNFLPQNRPHADGKLVDLNAAELCHGKVPEFMNGDHGAEHDQCGDQGDKN